MSRIRLALGFIMALTSTPAALAAETQAWYQVAVAVFAQPRDTDEDLTNQPLFAWSPDMRKPIFAGKPIWPVCARYCT